MPIAASHERYEEAEMWTREAACAVAKQLELRSASFPASANSALGCFVPARNKRSWVACTLFWSWLRFHQLTQRQKGWQPVKIPGASLLHPVSVCWTKRWREALADSAHQVSTYFFNLGRKPISWPWFHSRETCRMLIAGHGRMTLLRLSSSHPVARLHLCHEEKANCVPADLLHLHVKDNSSRKLRVTVKPFLTLWFGKMFKVEDVYLTFKSMTYPVIITTGDFIERS